MSLYTDTIFALSSGALPSGVAVVRLSGRRVRDVVRLLCGSVPAPRVLKLCTLRDLSGDTIDRGLVVLFEAPASFTGEDCAEFHVHGGRAVVDALLRVLSGLDGCRQALAGEFSRRAFENGKLDLVEAEGLGELIRAETETQRRLALLLSEGQLSRRYQDWMDRLSRARALIEAELDFSDEGDVPGSVSAEVWHDVSLIEKEMARDHADRSAEIIRDGFKVAIAGPPNAGKSSLLNYLAKRDVAIVTDIAGTTRDILTVDLDLEGYKVRFYDTAGIRETEDMVEKIGVERARAAVTAADLVLYLADNPDENPASSMEELGICNGLAVLTKTDLTAQFSGRYDISISVVTGSGIDSLMKRIQDAVQSASAGAFLAPELIRHRNNIASALLSIREALGGEMLPLEVRAEFLRITAEHLGRITGRVSADDLLGLIFSEFCIGK